MIPNSHILPWKVGWAACGPLTVTVGAVQLDDGASGLRVNGNTFKEMKNLRFQFIPLMSGEKPYHFWLWFKKKKKAYSGSTWSLLAEYFHFKIYSEKGGESRSLLGGWFEQCGVPEAEPDS